MVALWVGLLAGGSARSAAVWLAMTMAMIWAVEKAALSVALLVVQKAASKAVLTDVKMAFRKVVLKALWQVVGMVVPKGKL